MNPITIGAVREPRVFGICSRLGRIAARVLLAVKPRPRLAAWREHDPRKSESTYLEPVTPAHLLGAGGRAEFFRLPRL